MLIVGWAVLRGKQQEVLVNGEQTKKYQRKLARGMPGLPSDCLREVLLLFPRVRFFHPAVLACLEVARPAPAYLVDCALLRQASYIFAAGVMRESSQRHSSSWQFLLITYMPVAIKTRAETPWKLYCTAASLGACETAAGTSDSMHVQTASMATAARRDHPCL